MTVKKVDRYQSFRLYDYYDNRTPQLQLLVNTVRKTTDSKNGDDMPHFQSVINRGANATNRLSATSSRIVYRKGLISTATKDSVSGPVHHGWTEVVGPTPYVPTRPVPQAVLDEADSKAKMALIKKVKEFQSFNGPVIIGELRETIGHLKRPAGALRAMFYGFFGNQSQLLDKLNEDLFRTTYKRHRRRLVDRYTKDFADNWMELTFAVQPLIGTIKDVAENALPRLKLNQLTRLSATVPAEQSRYVHTGWISAGQISAAVSYDTLQRDRALCNYTVWVRDSVGGNHADYLQNIIDNSNMNWAELPGVAWELLPMSWLYDYFMNIGELLGSNFDYNSRIAFGKKAVTSDVLDTLVDFRYKKSGVGLIWVNFAQKDPYMLSYSRSFVRTPISALPGVSLGDFRLELPGTTGQFTNMASLARQKFDKCLNKWRKVRI